MILDKLLQLSDAQAITAGTTVSTNKVDLGSTTPAVQIGTGEPMVIVISVDVAAAGSTDTTAFAVVTDADAALGSPTVHSSVTIPNAQLTAGKIIILPIPTTIPLQERYLGLRVVLGSGDTITITAHVQPASMASEAYPRAYNVNYVGPQ